MPNRARKVVAAAAASVAVGLGVAAVPVTSPATARTNPTAAIPINSSAAATASRPNIVFVLTDDLSMNLVPFMPQVQQMMRDGMTFTNMSVTDSLCCPSRTSLLTGQFPHNHQVVSNTLPDGGFQQFTQVGDPAKTYAVTLRHAGYATGFVGKYLNGYDLTGDSTVTGHTAAGAPVYAQPGWSFWSAVDDNGYRGYNYRIVENNQVVQHGTTPRDYVTNVLGRLGRQFISQSVAAHKPFALELATFAPHHPFIPAPADRNSFPRLSYPATPAYNTMVANAPAWLAQRSPLTPDYVAQMTAAFRKRVQAVQDVDRWLGRLRTQLTRLGQADNTYIVFSSDNGFHMGEYQLQSGKMTAFDTDVHVPLIVVGPGVAPGSINHNIVENVDLAPTFAQLAGAAIPATVDGASLVPLLHRKHVPWRTIAGIEHNHPHESLDDPDRQPAAAGNLPSYIALRTATYTYVHYADGEREYYDRTTDPNELTNIYPYLNPDYVAQLDQDVTNLEHCAGPTQCWAAAEPTPTGIPATPTATLPGKGPGYRLAAATRAGTLLPGVVFRIHTTHNVLLTATQARRYTQRITTHLAPYRAAAHALAQFHPVADNAHYLELRNFAPADVPLTRLRGDVQQLLDALTTARTSLHHTLHTLPADPAQPILNTTTLDTTIQRARAWLAAAPSTQPTGTPTTTADTAPATGPPETLSAAPTAPPPGSVAATEPPPDPGATSDVTPTPASATTASATSPSPSDSPPSLTPLLTSLTRLQTWQPTRAGLYTWLTRIQNVHLGGVTAATWTQLPATLRADLTAEHRAETNTLTITSGPAGALITALAAVAGQLGDGNWTAKGPLRVVADAGIHGTSYLHIRELKAPRGYQRTSTLVVLRAGMQQAGPAAVSIHPAPWRVRKLRYVPPAYTTLTGLTLTQTRQPTTH